MITADKLKLLTNLPPFMLTECIRQAGYKKDYFVSAAFLGLSNGNQFVYRVTYLEDDEAHDTKVFITYDPTADKVSADY